MRIFQSSFLNLLAIYLHLLLTLVDCHRCGILFPRKGRYLLGCHNRVENIVILEYYCTNKIGLGLKDIGGHGKEV